MFNLGWLLLAAASNECKKTENQWRNPQADGCWGMIFLAIFLAILGLGLYTGVAWLTSTETFTNGVVVSKALAEEDTTWRGRKTGTYTKHWVVIKTQEGHLFDVVLITQDWNQVTINDIVTVSVVDRFDYKNLIYSVHSWHKGKP